MLVTISDLNCILARSYSSFILELNRTGDQRNVIELCHSIITCDAVSAVIRWLGGWMEDPGVQHGQTEINVDDVRCHQWLTNQIAEAPLHWRHEPTSIHEISVADTSRGKPPVYSCRRPRGSMFQHLRAEQNLSVLGTGVYFGTEITAIPHPL